MVDLDAYFERIGYAGPAEPTLDVLRALQALHPAAIPFENIDVLVGQGIDLDPFHIDSKLIRGRRGGYCFEQNNLFERVLKTIGFSDDSAVIFQTEKNPFRSGVIAHFLQRRDAHFPRISITQTFCRRARKNTNMRRAQNRRVVIKVLE